MSPFLYFLNKSFFSFSLSTSIKLVLSPVISTLYLAILNHPF